jgi:hypothetical protein
MKRIIFAGFLFITFVFFYAFEQPSHSSFGAQQESIFGQNNDDCTNATSNSNGDQWAKTYGGIDDDTGSLTIEKSDGSGYILAVDTFTFDAGGTAMGDIWILDLSLSGDIVWQRTYGGSDCDLLYGGIEETGDGGYVVVAFTGSFGTGNNDSWILKLTSSGDIEWQRTYGGSDSHNYPYSFQITSDGGYIVAGGAYSFSAEDYDAWVLKLTSSGDIEWKNTYGGGSGDRALSIQQTEDGGYIVAGWTHSFGAGGSDLWILKLTSSGDIEWQRTYGGSTSDNAYSVQQTSDGGYIVAGETESFGAGNDDIWVLKLSSTGTIDWQRTYGGSGDDWGEYIRETSDGGYIVAGATESFGAGLADLWVLKLTSSGDIEWQRTYGGTEGEYGVSIQETSVGGYIVAGSTKSFGAFRTEYDLWMLKLSQDGEISACAITGSSDASVSDTSISPSDTNVTPVSKNVITYNTDILPGESDATVHNLCPGPHTLTLSATAGGTTDPEPGTYPYDGGTEVIITATPSSGYTFSGWSGDVSSYYHRITIAMDSDKSITANFSQTAPEDVDGGDDIVPGKRGVCFIATAAYGSALHPYVSNLRNFRDRYLMQKNIGRKMVDLYYKYSPFIAEIIAKNKALKIVARISLFPVVAFSYSMVHFGPAITTVILAFIFVFPIFLIAFCRRKTRQAKDEVINMRPMSKIDEKRV